MVDFAAEEAKDWYDHYARLRPLPRTICVFEVKGTDEDQVAVAGPKVAVAMLMSAILQSAGRSSLPRR